MADSIKIFPPGWRAEDDNGNIVGGGVVEFFAAGTTDPLTVYSDMDLTEALGVTVGLNAGGYPVAPGGARVIVYTGSDPYRVRLKTHAGVVAWEHDNVRGALDTGNFDDIIAAQFPSGTVMLFGQTNAPPGWTKSMEHNNKALRIVNGTASHGGSAGFTSVFAERTLTQGNFPSVNFNISQTPHSHGLTLGPTHAFGEGSIDGWRSAISNSTGSSSANITVGSGGSATPIDFAVAYVDVIIAVKD